MSVVRLRNDVPAPGRGASVTAGETTGLGVASAHPFMQQGRGLWRKMVILALVIAIQIAIVLLYLFFTGRVAVPYMLVPVTIIPAAAH